MLLLLWNPLFWNFRKPSCCVFGYLLNVYLPQLLIQLNNWTKSHIFLVFILQYFFSPEIIVRILFFYHWKKCFLSHLENIDRLFLFHFKVDFGKESLSIFFLLDHFTIFEEILTISKKVGLEFDSLFLGRSFGDSRSATFDEIGSFESFAGSVSDGWFTLNGGTKGK